MRPILEACRVQTLTVSQELLLGVVDGVPEDQQEAEIVVDS